MEKNEENLRWQQLRKGVFEIYEMYKFHCFLWVAILRFRFVLLAWIYDLILADKILLPPFEMKKIVHTWLRNVVEAGEESLVVTFVGNFKKVFPSQTRNVTKLL